MKSSGTSSPASLSVTDPYHSFDTVDFGSSFPASNDLTLIGPVQSYQLSPSLDERSLGFFFRHNDVGGGQSFSRLQAEEHLLASMKALGLAGYANTVGASCLLSDARRYYLSAIRLTNAALSSPSRAKKDSTLLSIMILTTFETLTGSNPRSLEAWSHHVEGSAALIRLRGVESLKTADGRRLFRQSIILLLINCLASNVPVPAHIRALIYEAFTYDEDKFDIRWSFFEAFADMVDFRSEVKNDKITDPCAIFRRSQELDQQFVDSFTNLAYLWNYQVVYTDVKSPLLYSDHYHVYHNYVSPQAWNTMRNCRIILQQMMLEQLMLNPVAEVVEDPRMQITHCMNVLHQLQLDVFATVPQHLGFHPGLATTKVSEYLGGRQSSKEEFLWSGFDELGAQLSDVNENSHSDSLPILRTSGGYALPFSLYVAGAMKTGTSKSRQWVRDILYGIGHTQGVKHALVFAALLQLGLPMLGDGAFDEAEARGELLDEDQEAAIQS